MRASAVDRHLAASASDSVRTAAPVVTGAPAVPARAAPPPSAVADLARDMWDAMRDAARPVLQAGRLLPRKAR
jgi:hypothetical protein